MEESVARWLNPKFESPNPKQYRISNFQNRFLPTWQYFFEFGAFGFVWDLDIRIWNFRLVRSGA
jgi:hypothetical protein